MGDLLTVLAPILVVDVVNPVLLGLLVFAASSRRPFANSASLLVGHTVAYFLAGIAVSYGVEAVSEFLAERFRNPSTIDFVIGLVVGVFCLSVALRSRGRPAAAEKAPEWELTPAKCFAFGGVVNFIGVPFALPYFAAVDQILKAGLPAAQSITVLGIYNLGYALPFATVPLAVLAMGERAKPLLEKLNTGLKSAAAVAMPWLIGLLGVWLVFDAAWYFIVGRPIV